MLAAGVAVAVAVHLSGVGPGDALRFATYLVGAVVAPGLLVWRAARPSVLPAGPLLSLAGGYASGLLTELVVSLVARLLGWSGDPRWVPVAGAWAVALAVTVLVRRSDGLHPTVDRAPPARRQLLLAAAWMVAVVLPVLWLLADVGPSVTVPLSRAASDPRPDVFFHLALTQEAAHSAIPSVPWVLGEPLSYHWFVYTHLASASLLSGVDPSIVLLRLWFLPAVVATAVLVGATATLLLRSRWAGPIAGLVAVGLVDPVAVRWRGSQSLHTTGLGDGLWYSPTQTYGTVLLALCLLLVCVALRGRLPVAGWVVLLSTVAVLGGAKSVVLPILGAGLLAAFLRSLVARRRLSPIRWGRDALLLLGLGCWAGLALLLSVLFLYRGASQGLTATWPGLLLHHPLVRVTMGTPYGLLLPSGLPLLAFVVLALPKLLVLLPTSRPDGRAPDLARWFLAGQVFAAVLLGLATEQTGGSEVFFPRTAAPAVGILAAMSLMPLFAVATTTRRRWVLVGSLAALTAVAAVVAAPVPADGPRWSVGLVLAGTCLLVLAFAGGAGWVRLRLAPAGAVAAFAVIALAVTAAGVVRSSTHDPGPGDGVGRQLAAGLQWLDAHAAPDDVVATNRHCRNNGDRCLASQFTVAALGGRQVLVEGWSFTATANERAVALGLSSNRVPFWRPDVLARNDAAFDPALSVDQRRAAARALAQQDGVRWLVVQRDGRLVDAEGRARSARVDRPSAVLGAANPGVVFSNASIAIVDLRVPGALG